MTVYAIRPLALVDITDKDSADAAGDIFFWLKDHVIKPMHCRAQPTWQQCNSSATIDVNMVYQTFVVEYDRTACGAYAACNPDESAPDPSTAPFICRCHDTPSAGHKCSGFGQESISEHTTPQFKGDPTPMLAKKYMPGSWFSTQRDTECGNPHGNSSLPCTWRKYPGRIVDADCVNDRIISVGTAASGGEITACEKKEGRHCNFSHPVQTNLTDCCINAFVKGINSASSAAFVTSFEASFAPEDKGGCPSVPSAHSRANQVIV